MKKKEEVIEYKQRSNEKEISPLIEELAKKVHETWAEARISQGWTYGEQRDDKKKTHPCLVPYEELPKVKEYQSIFRCSYGKRYLIY